MRRLKRLSPPWHWPIRFLPAIGLTGSLAAVYLSSYYWVSLLKSLFPEKDLWDYLDVFIVPMASGLFVALVVLYLEARAKDREQRLESERESSLANERRTESLSHYYGRVASLLLKGEVANIIGEVRQCSKPEHKQDLLDLTNIRKTKEFLVSDTRQLLRWFAKVNDNEKRDSILRFLLETKTMEDLGIPLSTFSFCGADFTDVQLEGCNLTRIDFSGSILKEANLAKAILSQANLNEAELVWADLSGASLDSATLEWANLIGSNLAAADLTDAKLNGANLSESDLCGAILERTDLSNCILRDVIWDLDTKWPSHEFLHGVKSLPPKLMQQLGIF